MKENNCCVYKHTSPSNKVYIGITSKKPEHRWNNGKSYLGNKHFANAIQKYGWDNFTHEILFENLTREEACQKEIELIAFYKSNQPEFGYNHTVGGDGVVGIEPWNKGTKGVCKAWNKGKKMPEDFCKKVSKSKIGKTRKGKPHSDKTKKKISEKGKGRKLSEEARKNISEGHKGLIPWNKGKNLSEDTKKKMSKAHQNISEETRQKLSEASKGENNGFYGKHHSEETKRKISETKKKKA